MIYIVLQKEEVPVSNEKSQESAKLSMLDLLKSDDKLRNELFGHLN